MFSMIYKVVTFPCAATFNCAYYILFGRGTVKNSNEAASEEEQSLLRHEEEEEYPVDETSIEHTSAFHKLSEEEPSMLSQEQVQDLVDSQLKSLHEFEIDESWHASKLEQTEKLLLGLESKPQEDNEYFSAWGNEEIRKGGDPAKTLLQLEQDVSKELEGNNKQVDTENPFDVTPFAVLA